MSADVYIQGIRKSDPELERMVDFALKCGLQLDKVCGYVCSDPECPCGLGAVRS